MKRGMTQRQIVGIRIFMHTYMYVCVYIIPRFSRKLQKAPLSAVLIVIAAGINTGIEGLEYRRGIEVILTCLAWVTVCFSYCSILDCYLKMW